MNHRTYDGQRFAQINRDSVKGLKLAYAVPLGGADCHPSSEPVTPEEGGDNSIGMFRGVRLPEQHPREVTMQWRNLARECGLTAAAAAAALA
jgi:hypothetical protein